jgi:response regulator RpfG family c-di-GMP phosphodiesterase
MKRRVLFVDDDPNALSGFQRALRGRFEIDIAHGAQHGLQALTAGMPYAVVVSDMRMPVMNGIQFLQRAREVAPETVRMMLTGNADLDTAMEALNEGCIFQFLCKPCPQPLLAKALAAGAAQYDLIVGERELLEKTLRGSVKVLTDVLALVNPLAFSRAMRVAEIVRQIASRTQWQDAWKFELAALLSQLGCVTLAPETQEAMYRQQPLNDVDQQRVAAHPQVARDLIAHVPRLGEVAEMIARQREVYKTVDAPQGEPARDQVTAGARMLRVALDLDAMLVDNVAYEDALARLRASEGLYDPGLLLALGGLEELSHVGHEMTRVAVDDLSLGMVLQEDVRTTNGLLLIARGQTITNALLQRLANFTRINAVSGGEVSVRLPAASSSIN